MFISEDDDAELFRWTTRRIREYGYKNFCELALPQFQAKSRNDERWDEMYNRLVKYHRTYGHCRISASCNDPQLFHFVQKQRKEYRKLVAGNSSTLTEDRIEALEELEFYWGKSHDIRWQNRLQELEAFQRIYGHAAVPQLYIKNPKLGRWVMNQRTFHRLNKKGEKTSLRRNRINHLEQVGFVWNAKDKQWWSMFEELKQYQEQHGHLTIEASDFVHDSLRQWLNEQRHFYRSEKFYHRMSRERIDALESIPGFSWKGRRAVVPTTEDWSQLMGAIRDKGISPEAKAKRHWFDGVNPFKDEVKSVWTDDELLALWNEENDDDEEYDDHWVEDENSDFLRA
jgi:hypothetical protein